MTAPSIGDQLARSLVTGLGDHCGVAALLARWISANPDVFATDFPSLAAVRPGAAAAVTADFERRGWLIRSGNVWRTAGAGTLPADLDAFLSGAAAMRRAFPSEANAVAVVTMPPAPSALERALGSVGLRRAALVPTREAFDKVADTAATALTVMTPFLNPDGLDWALGLFRRTRARVRHLVVRAEPGCRATLEARRIEIGSAGVRVSAYSLAAPDGGYETFHAKVVLGDSTVAYVGSANLLSYGRNSMELGILADGQVAYVIAGVVRAVVAVAREIVL